MQRTHEFFARWGFWVNDRGLSCVDLARGHNAKFNELVFGRAGPRA